MGGHLKRRVFGVAIALSGESGHTMNVAENFINAFLETVGNCF